MSKWYIQFMDPPRATQRWIQISLALFGIFILAAATVNVPLAVTFIRSSGALGQISGVFLKEPPPQWPSTTPHSKPWPAPNYWVEQTAFGLHAYNVATNSSDNPQFVFQMEVQQMGWPLPVI